MRLRVPVRLIVDSHITAVKAGLACGYRFWSSHFLSGGNVTHVVLALLPRKRRTSRSISIVPARSISPSKAPARPCWRLCARASIRRSSTAQILNNPADSHGDAVARDGIGVKVRARVTVRSNLDRRWRRHGRNHHCARGRRHRDIDRFRGFLQGRSREPGPHL